MKPKHNYLNCRLAGIPYLLPYGQSIADHSAGLQLNDTGALLWDALNQGADRETMLAHLQTDCEDANDEQELRGQDLDEFLAELTRHGALLPDTTVSPYPERRAQIGPLILSLQIPDTLWETHFREFACRHSAQTPHQRVLIYPQPPMFRTNGNILVRSRELLIAETADSYLFLPLACSPLKEMHVAKDGSLAELYCPSPDDNALFHAIRFAFLVAAAQHRLYAVHSASVLYRERAWLFSGPSGAGKSTHTNLWKNSFGTPVLNGDLNLIGMKDGVPMCYGLPWNGTSGIRTAENRPLGGITFLKKSTFNQVRIPTPDRKILYLMQRLISPSWTADQLNQNLAFCERLAACTPMFRLHCTREPEAAQIMREAIDRAADANEPCR